MDFIFFNNDKNRQEWGAVVKQNQQVTYVRVGMTKNYDLEKLPPRKIEPNNAFKYNNSIPTFVFSDFNNEEAIEMLVREHQNEILESDQLIIDVCHNAGGTDLAYFPLLPFILNQPTLASELHHNETMSVLHSKRNCELRIEMLNKHLEATENPPQELRNYIENELKLYRENYGKGFIINEQDKTFDFFNSRWVKP